MGDMLVNNRVVPSIKLAVTPLYSWVEGGTMRVRCVHYPKTQDSVTPQAEIKTGKPLCNLKDLRSFEVKNPILKG